MVYAVLEALPAWPHRATIVCERGNLAESETQTFDLEESGETSPSCCVEHESVWHGCVLASTTNSAFDLSASDLSASDLCACDLGDLAEAKISWDCDADDDVCQP